MSIYALLTRLMLAPILLWVIASIVFLSLRGLTGNAADMLTRQADSQEQSREIAKQLHLSDSLPMQYARFIHDLVRLDLGRSYYSGQTVASLLFRTLPVTIELATFSALIMFILGVSSGAVAAALPSSPLDASIRFVAILLFSIPWFWLGILLILLFVVKLEWLPSFGRLPADVDYRPLTNFVPIDAALMLRFDLLRPWLAHIVLPAATVGLSTAGFVTRMTRASILETMQLEFVQPVRMKGAGPVRLFLRHILPNASPAILTIVGLQFGAMLGGSVVAEVVFSYPGVGRMLVDAIFQRDYPVIQGATIAIAAMYILINLGTDLGLALIDPRQRSR